MYSDNTGENMQDARIKRIIETVKEEFGISLRETFLDKVENPKPILRSMVNTAMNWRDGQHDLWKIGKELQREEEYKIPYRAELEVAAGLWYLIYNEKV
jgi:hypothetical protein